jgi:hypothetical protein
VDELSDLRHRIDALGARIRAGQGGPALAVELEAAIGDGYAIALRLDARRRRLDRRIARLGAGDAVEAGRFALERAAAARAAQELRCGLTGLAERHARPARESA